MFRLYTKDNLPNDNVYETEKEAKIACSEQNLSNERRFSPIRYIVKEENTSFYEVEFGRKDMPHDTDSICILGVREPSISEAEELHAMPFIMAKPIFPAPINPILILLSKISPLFQR